MMKVTVKELIKLLADCLKELELYTIQPVPLMDGTICIEKLLCLGYSDLMRLSTRFQNRGEAHIRSLTESENFCRIAS